MAQASVRQTNHAIHTRTLPIDQEQLHSAGVLPAFEFRCTPDEYENGSRESYTENSHACHYRHESTNYDELLRNFDRESLVGRIYYFAIKDCIDELVRDAIDRSLLIDDDDDEQTG